MIRLIRLITLVICIISLNLISCGSKTEHTITIQDEGPQQDTEWMKYGEVHCLKYFYSDDEHISLYSQAIHVYYRYFDGQKQFAIGGSSGSNRLIKNPYKNIKVINEEGKQRTENVSHYTWIYESKSSGSRCIYFFPDL